MVLGQPAYIEYGSLDATNLDAVVVIAPWTGKGWGPPCPVSIRFTYGYDVTLLYCGAAKTVCSAARKVAPEVERRYEAYSVSFIEAFNSGIPFPKFQFRGPLEAKDRALVARARRLGIPTNVTPGSGAAPAYMRNLNPGATEYFPLPLEGKLYLGAADHNASPNPSWPEWLFFVFEPPTARSRQLVPLAVITVQRGTTGVKSIEARNESAPPDESARLPMH